MASYHLSYTYDASGNRRTMIDHLTSAVTTYTHDPANQLIAEEGPGGVTTYTYDPNGNRTRKETPSDITDYSWDARGRLVTIEPMAGEVSLTYNADGQRVRKETPTGVVRYLFDFKKLLRETDDSDDPLREYTNTNDEYGDLVSEYDFQEDESSYYQYDAQPSTDTLLDESGDPSDRYQYSAFGLEQSHAGASQTPFTFVGKKGYYRDPEIGLYFLGLGGFPRSSAPGDEKHGRFYDPATGQFISKDPVGPDTDSLRNPYRYVANNPVNVNDPSGLFDEDAFWANVELLAPGTKRWFQRNRGRLAQTDFLFSWISGSSGYWEGDNAEIPVLEIDKDYDELVAAQIFIDWIQNSIIFGSHYQAEAIGKCDYESWFEWYYGQASKVVITGTELYLSALSIVNEGTDWIVTLNEASNNLKEGQYARAAMASLAFLPIIPGNLVRVAFKKIDDFFVPHALLGYLKHGKLGRGFDTSDLLRKVLPKLPKDFSWHHIVQQHDANIAKFGAKKIHNEANVIGLPNDVHDEITRIQRSIREDITGSKTLRVQEWIAKKSYDEQHKFGQELMTNVLEGKW